MWHDEKRRPGFAPQTRWAPLIVLVALGAGALVGKIHDHIVLGVFVLLIGLSGFYTAARMNRQRLADGRYTRGPGWWLGVLLAKTNVPFARAFYVILSIGICLLGIVSIAR